MPLTAVALVVVAVAVASALLSAGWLWTPQRIRDRALATARVRVVRPLAWEATWQGLRRGRSVRLVERHVWAGPVSSFAVVELHDQLADGLELRAHPALDGLLLTGARVFDRDREPVLEVERDNGAWRVDLTVRERMRTPTGRWIGVRVPGFGTEALDAVVALAEALERAHARPLERVAGQHGLVLSAPQDGQRQLTGELRTMPVQVQIIGGHWRLSVDAPVGFVARPGRGNSGNPVLDMLIAVSGPVPAGSEEAVLALVHGLGARVGPHAVRAEGQGWRTLEQALEAVAGLQPQARENALV